MVTRNVIEKDKNSNEICRVKLGLLYLLAVSEWLKQIEKTNISLQDMDETKCTMADLPVEIFSYIIRHLSLADINNLIRTNRDALRKWKELNQAAYDKIVFSSNNPYDRMSRLHKYRYLRYVHIDTAYHHRDWRTDYFIDACFRQIRLEKLYLNLYPQPIITNNMNRHGLEFLTHLEVRIKAKDQQVDAVENILRHTYTLETFIYHNGVLNSISLDCLYRNRRLKHLQLKNVTITDTFSYDIFLDRQIDLEHLIIDNICGDNIRTQCILLKITIIHVICTCTQLNRVIVRVDQQRGIFSNIKYYLLLKKKSLPRLSFLNLAYEYLRIISQAQYVSKLHFNYTMGYKISYGTFSFEVTMPSHRRIREYRFDMK